jgi:3-isopropylmalate dehydratase small subunit
VNIGLPIIRCAEAHRVLRDGDEVAVDALTGTITTATSTLHGEPPSGVALRIIQAGSLVDLIRRGGWAALEEERRVS